MVDMIAVVVAEPERMLSKDWLLARRSVPQEPGG
jgi:hypothetical protein